MLTFDEPYLIDETQCYETKSFITSNLGMKSENSTSNLRVLLGFWKHLLPALSAGKLIGLCMNVAPKLL